MKRAVLVTLLVFALAILAFGAVVTGCSRNPAGPAPAPLHVGASPQWYEAGNTPTVDRFTYASGAAGVYVVPTGFYVVHWWAHSTGDGGPAATVTLAPSGPRVLSQCYGYEAGLYDGGPDADATAPSWWGDAAPCQPQLSSITLPAGTTYGEGIPVLAGGYDELADGTTFVFTGTDSYVVTLHRYAP